MILPWRACAGGIVMAAMLSACSTIQSAKSDSVSSFVGVQTDAALATPAPVLADSPDYHIGPMDVLDVAVFKVPELSATVSVSESGMITLPLLGSVAAGGKTPGQLQADIARGLGGKYLQSPQVTVAVKDALSQRFTVEGAVGKPGIYAGTGKTTLLQALALAGGVTAVSDTRGVLVLRTVNGQRQAAKFDYGAIREGNAEDPLVLAGDVVVVDQSGLKAAWRGFKETIPVFSFFMPLL